MPRGFGSSNGGASGTPGTNGKTVRNGSGVPDNGMGANGDFYIDVDVYDIYGPKTDDDWGTATTLIGPTGLTGTSILSGSVAPGAEDGNDGDFWIDVTESDLYGPKTSGSWPPPVSLIGPQGDPGDNGTNGTDGKTVLSGDGPPADELGQDGDFYVDTTNWIFWGPKASGTWAEVPTVPITPVSVESELVSDETTTSTDFAELISVTLTTIADALDVFATFSGRVDTGDVGKFRLTLDGDPVANGGAALTGISSGALCKRLGGLAPGEHTIALEWGSTSGDGVHIAPAAHVGTEHATLLVKPSN